MLGVSRNAPVTGMTIDLPMGLEREASIPRRTLLEIGLPVEQLYSLAKREGNSKKPIYEMHKWWARRLGHVFRLLLIAGTQPAPRKKARSNNKSLLRAFYNK